ncbi:HIRAN domain-containing protein [Actinoplanes sp. NPDC051411]|uniref:HIRAN domain-containing protein n=1 Tax=Actinoplanes sp. NPDC051411 TaxID=3155522 RepID=UPI00341C7188
MDVPFELWGQRGWPGTDIVGESHYVDAIRDVFGREFREDGCELTTSAQLVPEPWNRHDRNAVGVWVAGRQVGYLSRDDAARYAPALSNLVADGRKPQVAARVWAASGYGDRAGLTGSVRIDLAEPHLIVPANRAPGTAHRVLPAGNAIQVTGEENHLDALLPWLRPEGECWVHVTLHEIQEQLPRSTRELIEVRLDRAPIGRLSPKMSAELLPAVRHLAQAGHLTAARALVRGNRIKVAVVVHAARAHELPESWLAASQPPDATIVVADPRSRAIPARGAHLTDGRAMAAGGPEPVGRRALAEGGPEPLGGRARTRADPGTVTVERPAGVAKPVVVAGGAHAAETSVTAVLADPATRHGEIPPPPAGIRFAVPPGWPEPPAGWSPPAGWRPEPAWPAAPPDWQWWVPFWA